jgi:hypothetical protein
MRIRNSWEGQVMTSVVTVRNLSQFDNGTFLSSIDGSRTIAAFPRKLLRLS